TAAAGRRPGQSQRGRSRTRASFRQAVDLDLDVVVQVVRRIPPRVEPDIPALRAVRFEQLAFSDLDVLLLLPDRDLRRVVVVVVEDRGHATLERRVIRDLDDDVAIDARLAVIVPRENGGNGGRGTET